VANGEPMFGTDPVQRKILRAQVINNIYGAPVEPVKKNNNKNTPKTLEGLKIY
jgi:hypothetical protein